MLVEVERENSEVEDELREKRIVLIDWLRANFLVLFVRSTLRLVHDSGSSIERSDASRRTQRSKCESRRTASPLGARTSEYFSRYSLSGIL